MLEIDLRDRKHIWWRIYTDSVAMHSMLIINHKHLGFSHAHAIILQGRVRPLGCDTSTPERIGRNKILKKFSQFFRNYVREMLTKF